MKSSIKNYMILILLFLVTAHCRESFIPDFETGVNDYLVVEGFINIGEKAVTQINLSHVSPLNSKQPAYENNASIDIESDDHQTFHLTRVSDGIYKSDSLTLDIDKSYRLLITIQGDKQYASTFTKVKITPVIDDVFWKWEARGVQIYVSSHDDAKKTQFYSWTYDETWEIRSDHESHYRYENGKFFERTDDEMLKLFICFASSSSRDLRFASTTKFINDEITYPLALVAHYSPKFQVRYSILATQRAMSEEEYAYVSIMQKNSTQTGSLFDAMPSELRGNIVSLTNPDEQVIGFIGAYTTQEKRIFITAEELGIEPLGKCKINMVREDSFDIYFITKHYIPMDSIGEDAKGYLYYTGAEQYCMDCTLRGTLKRPDFW